MFLHRQPDTGVAWRSFIYRHDGADRGGTASCSADSETSLRQSGSHSADSVITNLALRADWTKTGNSLLAEREQQSEQRVGIIPNLKTNAGQRFSDGATNPVS